MAVIWVGVLPSRVPDRYLVEVEGIRRQVTAKQLVMDLGWRCAVPRILRGDSWYHGGLDGMHDLPDGSRAICPYGWHQPAEGT